MMAFHEESTCPCAECRAQREEQLRRDDRTVMLTLTGILAGVGLILWMAMRLV